MRQVQWLFNGDSGSSGLMLCGLALMSQAVFLNGQDLDHSSSIDDGFVSAEGALEGVRLPRLSW